MSCRTISVVIPTRNRHEKLARALTCLEHQTTPHGEFETIVVDDGSVPAVGGAALPASLRVEAIRLEGVERSAARNAGAGRAKGEVLVFLDDDMIIRSDFLAAHLSAQREIGPALAVGAVRLPASILATPFGRFRQMLEDQGAPRQRGLVGLSNFCTAQNMSLPRARFLALGGFDRGIVSAEDQDLALRHSRSGGKIAYVPEAEAVHDDWAVDLASYCRRVEWGAEHVVPFCRRHPDLPDNQAREEVNGPVRWGERPLPRSLATLAKLLLSKEPAAKSLNRTVRALERMPAFDPLLFPLYRFVLGLYILRGFRRGLRRYAVDPGMEGAGTKPHSLS